MDQLLAVYTEIIRAAEDHQILPHLTNLVGDIAALNDAIKSVVAEAQAKAQIVNAQTAQ